MKSVAFPNQKDSGLNEEIARSVEISHSVLRTCDVLKCFHSSEQPLGLAEIASKCHLSKPTAYRILVSLVSGQLLERRAKNIYSLAWDTLRRKRFRLGYASQSEEFSFSRMVSESIRTSTYDAGLDLLILSNQYSQAKAVRNAEVFVREHVDLVIEFQTNEGSASTIAAILTNAAIPTIAIEIPHPGAIFFGANNHRAGLIAGRALAQACIEHWDGSFQELLLLDLPMAGSIPRSRLTGTVDGVRELIPNWAAQKVHYIDGNGRFESSLNAIRKFLRRNASQKILMAGINDPSCLGALTAFQESGRSHCCFAVSHNGSLEARRELRREGSRLVGSVGFFPEQYGEAVISLALDKLQGRQPPSSSFVKHKLLTKQTVNSFYPNDSNLAFGDEDSLLYSCR
jgi:ribose transport system substrate-binding protein